jgi:hypothetical protein
VTVHGNGIDVSRYIAASLAKAEAAGAGRVELAALHRRLDHASTRAKLNRIPEDHDIWT